MSLVRVLEAITPSRIGGAETYIANLCDEMIDQGAYVELFCPADRPFVDFASSRGLDVASWRTYGKFDLLTVHRLSRMMEQNNLDVIHTHLSTASILGAFAARLAGRSSVAHVHGLNTATCFKYSSAVIAVSEAVKRHLVAQGLEDSRVRVVHNGVDLDKFHPIDKVDARLKLAYDTQKPILGVFGRLSSEKGQRIALNALAMILRRYPDVRLIVTGQGKDGEVLQNLADSLGIATNVQFTGFIHNTQRLVSACDIVLVPSLKEGFGLAAVEAMALERPVVASNVGGLPEVVTDGETGYLVPPNDSKNLAGAVMHLIEDPLLAANMGRRGRERVGDCFQLKTQTSKVLNILQEVI